MTIKLTYADYVAQAGLAETALMSPKYDWQGKAYISMGNRLHGDNLNSDWFALYSGAPYYAELIAMPWSDIVAWVWFQPGANNTATNMAVKVYDAQIQIFNTTTQQWELVSAPAYGRELRTTPWYDLVNYNSAGAADLIYPTGNRYNLPAFSTVKTPGDRLSAADLPDDIGKFYAAHNSVCRAVNVDYSKIGGVVVLCRAKLVSIDGDAANGVSEIMMCVGADAYPTPNSMQSKGLYTTLGGNIVAGDTTIPVANGTLLPTFGTVKIDSETITYTSISGNNMLGCTRGVNGTTPASHTSGANIDGLFKSINIMPSMTIGAFSAVTTTEKAFMATTALLKTPQTETIVQTSSAYQQSFPAGTYPQCMTAAQFAANVPQLMTF